MCSFAHGQSDKSAWYSESLTDGIRVQNSFPKGGPYFGETETGHNHSHLVFFTRLVNETDSELEVSIQFSGDSIPIPIPGSFNTYMKLFLPPDTMTLEKQYLFSYGFSELQSLDQNTSFERNVAPGEDCLFYVVAIFYQTKAEAWEEARGGNRAKLIVDDQKLFYQILPQLELLECGTITFR